MLYAVGTELYVLHSCWLQLRLLQVSFVKSWSRHHLPKERLIDLLNLPFDLSYFLDKYKKKRHKIGHSTGEAASFYLIVHKKGRQKSQKKGNILFVTTMGIPCKPVPPNLWLPASRTFLSREGKRSLRLQCDRYKVGVDTYDSMAYYSHAHIWDSLDRMMALSVLQALL